MPYLPLPLLPLPSHRLPCSLALLDPRFFQGRWKATAVAKTHVVVLAMTREGLEMFLQQNPLAQVGGHSMHSSNAVQGKGKHSRSSLERGFGYKSGCVANCDEH